MEHAATGDIGSDSLLSTMRPTPWCTATKARLWSSMAPSKTTTCLVSMLASQLGPALNTVQVQPVCVGAQGGSEVIAYQGRVQPILTPSSLASVLTLPNGPLSNLQKLRDQTVDSLNAYYRSQGVPAQQNFIDKYVASQTQLRDVSDTLLSQLAAIKDNSAASQILAAIALFKMNVTPVVSIHIPMGGDNHGDNNLAARRRSKRQGWPPSMVW